MPIYIHQVVIYKSLQGCNGRAFLSKRKCVGSIPHKSKVILKTDQWSCPAPRAPGLRRKRQCGVPTSYEEIIKTIYMTWGRCTTRSIGSALNCIIIALKKRTMLPHNSLVFAGCRIRTKVRTCSYYETFEYEWSFSFQIWDATN
jgi:hypothetical protein